MKNLHARKLLEYGLLALVLFALAAVNSGCSNVEIANSVPQSVSVIANPERTAYILYSALPTGQEAIAVVSQVGAASPNISTTITGNAAITVEITENLAAKGWSVVPWNQLPGPVQLVVLSTAEDLLQSTNVLKVLEGAPLLIPVGVFNLMPGLMNDCTRDSENVSCKL